MRDHRVVGLYTGKILIGFAALEIPALATSLVFAEWNTALDFVIGILACASTGLAMQLLCATRDRLHRRHGFVTVAISWLLGTILGAIPFLLSGHYGSPIDAIFDVMSGLTTTGLYLIQDLDHIAQGLSMWRFTLTYAGGQGIIVVALAFMSSATSGMYDLYAGEGKDERIVPHVAHTARVIWTVSLWWLVIGTIVLGSLSYALGETPVRSALHGLWMFMGAFSTGGFAPQSYNTIWFHSSVFETITIIISVAGSLNFALHWAVWQGNPRELIRNIETRTFVATLSGLIFLAAWTLSRTGIYGDKVVLFRKVFYQLASAHTTTGFGTIASRSFVTQWGPAAMVLVTAAMALGGSACSTAGGIKSLRIGLITKSFITDIRRTISPESMQTAVHYHHIRDHILGDKTIRNILTITVLFLSMYGAVTVAGVLAGYPLLDSLFDGVSAASNSGLSCGLLSPAIPTWLKAVYTMAMWLGRMEFLSVFALAGWLVAVVRGR